jgi:hypothetical protein
MWTCKNCEAENRAQARFCASCGKALDGARTHLDPDDPAYLKFAVDPKAVVWSLVIQLIWMGIFAGWMVWVETRKNPGEVRGVELCAAIYGFLLILIGVLEIVNTSLELDSSGILETDFLKGKNFFAWNDLQTGRGIAFFTDRWDRYFAQGELESKGRTRRILIGHFRGDAGKALAGYRERYAPHAFPGRRMGAPADSGAFAGAWAKGKDAFYAVRPGIRLLASCGFWGLLWGGIFLVTNAPGDDIFMGALLLDPLSCGMFLWSGLYWGPKSLLDALARGKSER